MRTMFGSCCSACYLLTSVCLRYAAAMASVWLRGRCSNSLGLNDFGFDYPLNFNWFSCPDWSTLEVSCAGDSRTAAGRIGRWFPPQCLTRVDESPLNDGAFGSLIAKTVTPSMRLHPLPDPVCRGHQVSNALRCPHGCLNWASSSRVSTLRLHSKSWGSPFREAVLTTYILRRFRCGVLQADLPEERTRKELVMDHSRGTLSFTPLFTTDDIGLRKDANVEHVVKVFLTVGEAMATRWIEMPRGILLLQTVPDQPASGAIYLYDRERHIFFFVDFVKGRNDALTAADFDQLVAEYDLVSWTANPELLPCTIGNVGMA